MRVAQRARCARLVALVVNCAALGDGRGRSRGAGRERAGGPRHRLVPRLHHSLGSACPPGTAALASSPSAAARPADAVLQAHVHVHHDDRCIA